MQTSTCWSGNIRRRSLLLASVTSRVISVDLEYMFKNSMSQVHCSVSIPLGANPKTGRYSEAEVFQFSPKCPVALWQAPQIDQIWFCHLWIYWSELSYGVCIVWLVHLCPDSPSSLGYRPSCQSQQPRKHCPWALPASHKYVQYPIPGLWRPRRGKCTRFHVHDHEMWPGPWIILVGEVSDIDTMCQYVLLTFVAH